MTCDYESEIQYQNKDSENKTKKFNVDRHIKITTKRNFSEKEADSKKQ